MIRDVKDYPISQLLDIEAGVVYAVPRYQREYTWSKGQWEKLFDDVLENDDGYFLGSIICINQSTDTLSVQRLELVDGQQRMTTISLLFTAIYSMLNQNKDLLSEEQRLELLNLKRKIILKKDAGMRIIPQIQNNNLQDYQAVLAAGGIIENCDTPPYAGNRKIFKAYRYFQDRIESLTDQTDNKVSSIMQFLEKVNKAVLVKIEVANHSGAYTLFESLNNRGVPLTAIDLIKNKLLARLEQVDPGQIEKHFNHWNRLVKCLGEDYVVQERFFRQYYNALKSTLGNEYNVPVATSSNLIQIYERLIEKDAKGFLEKILIAGKFYSLIIGGDDREQLTELTKPLLNLDRIQGTPSYLLLLALFVKKEDFRLEEGHLLQIINLLVSFFVRRNLTDMPPTRDLIRIFMSVVEKIEKLQGQEVVKTIQQELGDIMPNDDMFRKKLEGSVYAENAGVVRFVLCALEEKFLTREKQIDLWSMDGKQYVWTIEHIFPQGENIPQAWVDMVAHGDRQKAEFLQKEHVHRLGNLTISGFNSTLSDRSFEDKRDRKNRQGLFVGYRNGLYLNADLERNTEWTVEQIEKRTKRLVDETLVLFQMRGIE